MTPPTWRDLGRRAKRLGLSIDKPRGRYIHQVVISHPRDECALVDISSWFAGDTNDLILRAAVAAALDQLERRA